MPTCLLHISVTSWLEYVPQSHSRNIWLHVAPVVNEVGAGGGVRSTGGTAKVYPQADPLDTGALIPPLIPVITPELNSSLSVTALSSLSPLNPSLTSTAFFTADRNPYKAPCGGSGIAGILVSDIIGNLDPLSYYLKL